MNAHIEMGVTKLIIMSPHIEMEIPNLKNQNSDHYFETTNPHIEMGIPILKNQNGDHRFETGIA